MPIRLLRYLIVSLCIPFAVVASEIDYRQIQKDLNSMGYNVGIADGIPGLNTSNGIQNFLNDAGYTMPSEITDNEQDFIQNIAFFASKPLNFMREIITAQLEVRDLTDQQLCELNLHLDLVDSFYEIQRRGINCPSGTEIVIRYEGQLLHDPIELLRSFQRQHQITIPSFDLTASRTFYNWDETKQNYLFLNPNFEDLLGHDAQRVSYCSDWMPQVGSIPTDPSKNLDGTGSWANDTLRDGFVICQDSLNMLYLEALSSDKLLSQESTDNFQNIVETWMETDRGNNLPFRPYHPEYNSRAGRAGPNFTYLITISKLMAGVELLKSQFQWSSEQQNKYAQWSRNRVLQMLPVSGRTYILRDSICDLNVNKDNMNNACMNAAPYIAQGLLRAAIAGNDTELAELSYLVFKQYSSAIRPDGSQAYDSIRDCYAADYTVWAAEFLHDYVYLASTAGVNLWEDQFSSMHGSPRENVEYALEVRRNPDVVNDYAQDFGFTDCQENDGQIVQRVVNKPAASFAYYLYTFTPEKINEIYLEARSNLFSYTGASGVNYEVDLINTNSELKELLSDGSAHGTRQKIETINWYIALRDDDYKAVLEGKDIISIAPNFQIIDASYEDVTKEGIQGREALVYQFTEDFIHIEGTVTLVGNERVYVNFKERIEVGQAEIIFGPLDKLIISWKD
jgi:peptidoglycan hydrolase-like protein with peptidoglycan-binding domain